MEVAVCLRFYCVSECGQSGDSHAQRQSSEFESIHMRVALSLLVLVEMVMVAMGAMVANGPDYLALKAADKLNVLWGNCIEELQSSRWFNLLEMAGLFVEPMCPVFRLMHIVNHVHSLSPDK